MKIKIFIAAIVIICLHFSAIASQPKPVSVIPFEVVNGSIILKVKINNNSRILRLLFDTGADGMAVSKALADSLALKPAVSQNASVVGGSMKIDVSRGNSITMQDGFVINNQGIAIFSEIHKGFDGIIGNTIAKSYVTKIDFNNYELSLYDFENYEYEKGGVIVPITIPDGLFIIPGNIEITTGKSHTGNFVFDTGASYNLICFRPFVKQNKLLISGFKSDYHASTVSMGISSPTFNGNVNSFSFANKKPIKNMPITLMAGGGQNESWNPGFDGSIGMGIISKYNFTINYKKNEIHFIPNHSFNYPLSFTLSPYLFEFNLYGELEVSGYIRVIFDNEKTLALGTKIVSINGIATEIILKEPNKINQLKAMLGKNKLRVKYVDEKGNQDEAIY